MRSVSAFAMCVVLGAPGLAMACGGLFCDASQPVNQAAERIFFTRDVDDPERIHMIVQIQYQGPEVDFGWLLPVPPDVESRVGFESLFTALDDLASPWFDVRTEVVCEFSDNGGSGGAGGAGGAGGGSPGVAVLSQEAVGPYEQAILRADGVGALRAWLDENGYAVPRAIDERLGPYLEQGSAFLALRLRSGRSADDIVPLHMTFTSPAPGIPLRPTAVAAEPDMGIVVHLLGPGRAVPLNYALVEINEALIDWRGSGGNYPDVVAHAVDEAEGGLAFATDSAMKAGGFAARLQALAAEYADDALPSRMASLQTLGDLCRVYKEGVVRLSGPEQIQLLNEAGQAARAQFTGPEEEWPIALEAGGSLILDWSFLEACAWDDWPELERGLDQLSFDGAAFAEGWRARLRPGFAELARLGAQHPMLTRLYTTLSPDEMSRDPVFGFNPDLPEVPRRREARASIYCGGDGFPDASRAVVRTPGGLYYQERGWDSPLAARRSEGRTIRAADEPGAAVIYRAQARGPLTVIEDRRDALRRRYTRPTGLDDGRGESGCTCRLGAGGASASWLALLLLALGAPWRRTSAFRPIVKILKPGR